MKSICKIISISKIIHLSLNDIITLHRMNQLIDELDSGLNQPDQPDDEQKEWLAWMDEYEKRTK